MRIWSATALLVISIGCTASSIPATGDAVAEVRAVWTKQVDAWNRGDLEGFMEGYWKSPDLVFFTNNGETRGWQQTLENYRKAYQSGDRKMGTLDFPQLEFKELSPNAVLARGRWRLKMPDGKELTGMTSVTFQKLPEGWRIVHDHSSAPAN
jgi:uncharacterized protein (TIGR02246 family)